MAAVLQYVRVFAAILFYLCMYVCVGALMPEKVHEKSLINMLIAGFMAYFAFFQVIALFCKAKGVPLHVLSALWFSFLVAAAALDLVFRRQMLAECIREQIRRIKKEAVLRGMLAASVAFAFFIIFNTDHISDFDAGYYIGLIASSAYSDTIERVAAIWGYEISAPQAFYFLNTIPDHASVMVQVLHIPALLEEKIVFSFTNVLVFMAILYRIGTLLFAFRKRQTALFVWISTAVLMFSYSLAGISHYFAYRTYEGKAVCAYLYMPAILAFFLCIYTEGKAGQSGLWGWFGMFFAGLGGVAFCNSAIFVIPFAMFIYLFSMLFYRRSRKQLLCTLTVFLPAAAWLILYVRR